MQYVANALKGLKLQVLKCIYKGVNPIAVKVLHAFRPGETLQEDILKEVQVLRACRHPHIIQVIIVNIYF
jgi:hypothetical protein